jgi:hypothetical protein
MSIKTSADEWVRKGPTQAISVIAAVALVLGLVVGLGVGYKIEQSRTRKDVKRLQAQVKAGGGTGTKGTTKGSTSQRIGTVTTNVSGTITVSSKQRGKQVIDTTADTLLQKVVAGKITDVKAGQRVIVTPGGVEIVVLGSGSKLGRVVETVASDSISLGSANGSPASKVKTTDVKKVFTLTPATNADIKKGVLIIAGGSPKTQLTFDATEVIVLTAGSAFGK